MVIFDPPVTSSLGMDIVCRLSLTAPYGKLGERDWFEKRKWCESQGWQLNVDYNCGLPLTTIDFNDWSNYNWYFSNINNAYYFLFRWSS